MAAGTGTLPAAPVESGIGVSLTGAVLFEWLVLLLLACVLLFVVVVPLVVGVIVELAGVLPPVAGRDV